MAPEAERLVQKLRTFEIKEVIIAWQRCPHAALTSCHVRRCRRPSLQICSPEWLQQHEALQRLNMQEHYSVMKHTDEFVKEAILDEEKLAVLVHELLAIEVRVRCHLPVP